MDVDSKYAVQISNIVCNRDLRYIQWSLPKRTLREADNPSTTNKPRGTELTCHEYNKLKVSEKRTILYNEQKPCPQRVRYSETPLYILGTDCIFFVAMVDWKANKNIKITYIS